ncbi:MAG: type II secretion system F family protein [Actinomycetota bacterium]|nr:type II secretion system F family protein [Actinomycetota bacterium]
MNACVRRRRRLRSIRPDRSVRFSGLRHAAGAFIAAADVDPWIFVRRSGLGMATAVAGAVMLFGLRGALVAPPVFLAGAVVWLRREKSARLTRIEDAFPGALRAVGDAVRAGLNVQQALGVASDETPRPLNEELAAVTDALSLGVSMESALQSFAQRCPVPGAELFCIALVAASRSGADLPPVLDCIIDAARDRQRLRREMRAATAQGRLTACVVGGLPAVFLLVMGAGAHAEIHFLFGEPLGWALLIAGALLELAGFAWINRVVKTK